MAVNFEVSGKICVVTGGGSGIGLGLTRRLSSSGARVIIADLGLSSEAEELVRRDRNVRFTRCDVSVWSDLESIVPFSKREFGDVPDVYAANAGVCEPKWSNFWDDHEDGRYKELDINLGHPIKLTRIAIRTLHRQRKKGVVLITASIAGLSGNLATPLYCASKHGTMGFIKSLARLEKELGVKVVGICPGVTQTPLLLNLEDKLVKSDEPFELITTDEIAQRMIDLVQLDKYTGGTCLAVFEPGDATIVADGKSKLEELTPADMGFIRGALEADQNP